MKLLYGVVGEGMGHAMRSRVVLEHLVGQGHELQVMASGRAVDFLSKRFEGVHRIHGLHMIYEENRVRKGKTLWSNALTGAASLPKQIGAYFDLISSFDPDAVVSDFESWTYLYGKNHRKPVFSIDNMQIINRCTHEGRIIAGHETAFGATKMFIKSKLPFCDHYAITTFFYPPLRKPNTSLHPPILRPEILAATPSVGDHLLVYQTAEGNEGLADGLARTGVECRIYGMRRDLQEEQVEGTLCYRPFSEAGFIADLASARAVIAGGGFTLMGEAVYLKKPMLSVPVAGQVEQIMNGRYLEQLGYGRYAESLGDPKVIQDFLEVIPACQDKLAKYSQDGNKQVLGQVDHLLDCVASGIYPVP
jgi:uncharacterized protein (TIGR00661 family)